VKYLILLLLAVSVTACKSVPYGYRSYDPCIACGETWTMHPPEEFAAIKEAERQGFSWRD